MLNLYFMGKSRIEYAGKRLEDKLGTKAIALLCILILNENKYISREKIEGYLWPDSDTQAARYNLRYNLWLIKKNIGSDENNNLLIFVDNECCCVNTNYKFKCDIIDIMKFKPTKDDSVINILKLTKLFQGDLLEGFYFKNCDELNDLILFERMQFEKHEVRILKRLVELYECKKNYDACIQTINSILEIEPYDEGMVLNALDIYVKHEKPVDAITYYNNFSEILSSNLGVFPSANLKNKYQEIRDSLSSFDDNGNIENDKNKFAHSNFKQNTNLKITSDCIKGIEYFWIADVIGKLLENISTDCIEKLDENELLDLGSIQNDVLTYYNLKNKYIQEYDREVLSVNIVNAFIKLLKCICKSHNLQITILNSSSMDNISLNVLNYLKRLNINGLSFVEN